jgi:hypothetical protein
LQLRYHSCSYNYNISFHSHWQFKPSRFVGNKLGADWHPDALLSSFFALRFGGSGH